MLHRPSTSKDREEAGPEDVEDCPLEETSDSRKAVAFCDMVMAYLGSIIWDGAIGEHFG